MLTAVVTGANRGIGLEFCRQLKRRGYTVVAACRTSSPELERLECRVATGVDVTDAAAVARFAAEIDARSVDWLIHNAGILEPNELGTLDYASVQRQFSVNAVGPLRLTEALLPKLRQDAKVALVTSRMGSIADNTSGGSYGYRMSKAALNAAGKSLAHDLLPRGVAVVILHPGYVRTDMTGHQGFMDPPESASKLILRLEELTLETSGRFFHASGEELPW